MDMRGRLAMAFCWLAGHATHAWILQTCGHMAWRTFTHWREPCSVYTAAALAVSIVIDMFARDTAQKVPWRARVGFVLGLTAWLYTMFYALCGAVGLNYVLTLRAHPPVAVA